MRVLVQRVNHAQVSVDNEICGKIGPGLLVLLGVHKEDTEADIPWLAEKVCNLRIFRDENDKMNLSVKDIEGEVLVVSQFTLYGNCANGRRPDFIQSASGEEARALYLKFADAIKERMGKVETGRFAAYMQVSLENDGPVTLIIDSKKRN